MICYMCTTQVDETNRTEETLYPSLILDIITVKEGKTLLISLQIDSLHN